MKPRPSRPFQEHAVDFGTTSSSSSTATPIGPTSFTWAATPPPLTSPLPSSKPSATQEHQTLSDQTKGPNSRLSCSRISPENGDFNTSLPPPMYPQYNGKAEATVKSMKKIIQASWTCDALDEHKLTRALLQYRNTPSQRDRLSPAQKLFGQPIQDTLPAHRRAFAPQWQISAEEVEEHAVTHAEQVEHYYNQHARALPEIHVVSNVAIQNTSTKLWDIYGIVTAIGPHRQYYVKTASGRVLARNRRYLRHRVPLAPPGGTAGAPQPPQEASLGLNPPPPP